MKKLIPQIYRDYLESRRESVLGEQGKMGLSWRAFWIGGGLSFFLAIGAPYGNMIIRGSYMALDFSTPGAIFLFLLLIGLLNLVLKVVGGAWWKGLLFAAPIATAWYASFIPAHSIDFQSPGFIVGTFFLATALINLPVAARGGSLALNRGELALVYAMLLIVSALCTMGLSEQILPMITAIFYYATPENKWAEKLLPHQPRQSVLVDDGTGSKLFYEGLEKAGDVIPYQLWLEPLLWWGAFLMALYVTMVSLAVIVRRQWMERERLAYPIAQVGLAMIRGEDDDRLVNNFFRQKAMWAGLAMPLLVGSLTALHRYDPAVPVVRLTWNFALLAHQSLQLTISFALLGFSYFINANIAAGIWAFHLVSKFEKEIFLLAGIKSEQKIGFGVSDYPYLAYQGVGALIAMVLVGLWVGREHYGNVVRKALGLAPEVEDGDEILSYRSALAGAVGGAAFLTWWQWTMGTPAWIALLFVVLALLIFLGITRIVAEAGLAAVRAPMIAPDLVAQGVGAAAVGPTGVFNMSLAYIWAADIRVFVMATCTNALKLIEEMEPRHRRVVFGAIILALFIGSVGALWMIFSMAYRHGGINLNGWFFKGLPEMAYNTALRNMENTQVYWPGMGFFAAGGLAMTAMMWARQRLPWWPLHPIGFPIGANSMMNHVWFSVFLAWAIKKIILRYGGQTLYRNSQGFFLGLIAGQVLCNGLWLIIDYFTGKVGNSIFWV